MMKLDCCTLLCFSLCLPSSAAVTPDLHCPIRVHVPALHSIARSCHHPIRPSCPLLLSSLSLVLLSSALHFYFHSLFPSFLLLSSAASSLFLISSSSLELPPRQYCSRARDRKCGDGWVQVRIRRVVHSHGLQLQQVQQGRCEAGRPAHRCAEPTGSKSSRKCPYR